MYNNNFDENIVIHKKKRKISLNNNVKYITDNNIIHLQLNVNNYMHSLLTRNKNQLYYPIQ